MTTANGPDKRGRSPWESFLSATASCAARDSACVSVGSLGVGRVFERTVEDCVAGSEGWGTRALGCSSGRK